jgi:hypothetical protein
MSPTFSLFDIALAPSANNIRLAIAITEFRGNIAPKQDDPADQQHDYLNIRVQPK